MGKFCKRCGGESDNKATQCRFCGCSFNGEKLASEFTCSFTDSDEKISDIDEMLLFSENGWQKKWSAEKTSNDKIGIILTDTRNLKKSEKFLKAVRDFITLRKTEKIQYVLLDLNKQAVANFKEKNCNNIVDILSKIYNVEVPDYLLLVGDSSVIPSVEWENESGDDDAVVPSDLLYITLDTESPWSGKEFNFENITSVGRIPTSYETMFEEAVSYFTNILTFRPYNEAKSLVYSAQVWKDTSLNICNKSNPRFITSPEYSCNKELVKNKKMEYVGNEKGKYNMLCFNLHGSDASHNWYGQLGKFYPEAFDGNQLFLGNENGYIICTEACYGARPQVKAKGEQSIVVEAIKNKCIAFVGSSRIAYGRGDGGLSCADVIANEYLLSLYSGKTCGESFLKALNGISEKSDLNENQIKTLAEFALYGDPSVKLINANNNIEKKTFSVKKDLPKTKKDKNLAINLMSCAELKKNLSGNSDIKKMAYGGITADEIDLLVFNVREKSNRYISEKFETFSGVEPNIYKVIGKDGFRAVYSQKSDKIKSCLKVFMGNDCKVDKVYISK